LNLVKEVRELLSDPNRWTKYVLARKKNGEYSSWDKPEAYSFCLIGACDYVAAKRYASSGQILARIHRKLFEKTGDSSIARFNDNATHEQVLALLDEVTNEAGA
jgi:hypothetical protein